MPTIKIPIKNKIAGNPNDYIVNGNSDYKIEFEFDKEWEEYNVKTARFIYNGKHEDVVFEGKICDVPVITKSSVLAVGVFTANLRTTTPALIRCAKSILCDEGLPADPTPDVYAQLMEIINGLGSDEKIEQVVEDYLAKNPPEVSLEGYVRSVNGATPDENGNVEIEVSGGGDIDPDSIQEIINDALSQAKASGEFDGDDGITPHIGSNDNWYIGETDTGVKAKGEHGKSAYQYAKDGGYTGTEGQFATKLAKEYPTNVSELNNDAGYITGYNETDPTVPNWAKQPTKPSYTAKEVGALPENTAIPKTAADIGAQPEGDYALRSEIPSVPVISVNGKTGAVQLSASDVKARPENWMPSAQEVGALPNTYTPPNQTAEQVGADPKGTAATAVSQHNTSNESHGDIRLELKAINDRLTAFFDSDDQTLDELSEIVAYITSNKALIESITTSKVSVSDIINNLTTNVNNKPLSAAQGVALKGLIDAVSNSLANYQPKGDYALKSQIPVVPTKVSAFENDKGYLTQHQDISGKLDAAKLPEAIDDALAQAKASGEFDGEDGTSATHSWNGTTLTITSASGTSSANLKGDKGDAGSPASTEDVIEALPRETWSFTLTDGGSVSKPIPVLSADGTETAYYIAGNYAIVRTWQGLLEALSKNETHIRILKGATLTANSSATVPEGTVIDGLGGKVVRATGFEKHIFRLAANCRISDITIDGNRTAMVSPSWSTTIEIATYTNCVVENITINNGNEGIVVYGDDNIVRDCNLTNCGGNGIHFSGANRVRVENCNVTGSNKRSGMGHEEGCIIWSDDCTDIVCINNWCEDGKSGFGSLDSANNGNAKIIGNTVKNCTEAIDFINPGKAPENIIVSNNHFINSGSIMLNNTDNNIPTIVKIIIDGNILENTQIKAHHFSNITITNNIFKDGQIEIKRCADLIISNNNIDTKIHGIAISVDSTASIRIHGNKMRATDVVLRLYDVKNCNVSFNTIRQNHIGTKSAYAVFNSAGNTIFEGNTFALYGKGIALMSYNTFVNNILLMADSSQQAIWAYTENVNTLVSGNRTNGTKSPNIASSTSGSTKLGEFNDLVPFDDVFANCTMTLTNCTSNAPAKATMGDELTITLTANSGYSLPTSISGTNNGIALKESDYSYDSTTGVITIYAVFGAIAITATA